jgi:hypothetical protein
MIVRIQLRQGPAIARKRGKNRHLALACAALLIPASLMAYVLGFWRLASDIGMTQQFAIGGLFSHWQIWIGMAVTLHLTASALNRYGRSGELQLPRALTFRFGSIPRPPAGSESSRDSSSRSRAS